MSYSLPDGSTIGWQVLSGRRGASSLDVWDTATWGNASWDGGSVIDYRLVPESVILGITGKSGKDRFGKRYRASTMVLMLDNQEGLANSDDAVLQPGDYVWVSINVQYPAGPPDEPIPDGWVWNDDTGRGWTAHGSLIWADDTPAVPVNYDVFYGRVDNATDSVTRGRDVTKVTAYDGFAELAPITKDAVPAEGAGDDVFVRVIRIGDNASTAFGGIINSGTPGAASMQATTLAQGALDMMHLTVESEGGDMWADRGPGLQGKTVMQVRGRDWISTDPRSTNIQYVLGGGSGLPIVDGKVTREQQLLVNDATVSNVGGVAQNNTDPGSVQRYGIRTTRRLDLIADADTQAQFLAARFVTNLKDVRPRIREVSVPVLDADSAAFAATVLHGDLVLTTVRSIHGWAYTALAHVIGIRRTVFEKTYTVALVLDDAFVDNVDGAYNYLEFSSAFTLGGQP